VLRASGVSGIHGKRYFLGWKGHDRGRFANLRREFNEETSGRIENSVIMRYICKTQKVYLPEEIEPALDLAGYTKFMSYQGHGLTGRYEALGVNTKLMHCQSIRWPILVELEIIAATQAEARKCQNQLERICHDFRLEDHLVKEEPGTLLYQKTFGE
jgi:hypothetical protein